MFTRFRDTNTGPALVLFYFVRENDNNDARTRRQVMLDAAGLTCDTLLFSYPASVYSALPVGRVRTGTLTSDEPCSAADARFVRHHDGHASVTVGRPLYGQTRVFLFIKFFLDAQ